MCEGNISLKNLININHADETHPQYPYKLKSNQEGKGFSHDQNLLVNNKPDDLEDYNKKLNESKMDHYGKFVQNNSNYGDQYNNLSYMNNLSQPKNFVQNNPVPNFTPTNNNYTGSYKKKNYNKRNNNVNSNQNPQDFNKNNHRIFTNQPNYVLNNQNNINNFQQFNQANYNIKPQTSFANTQGNLAAQHKFINSKFSPTNINHNGIHQIKNNSIVKNNVFNTNNVPLNNMRTEEKNDSKPLIHKNIVENSTALTINQNNLNSFGVNPLVQNGVPHVLNNLPFPNNFKNNNFINYQQFNVYNHSIRMNLNGDTQFSRNNTFIPQNFNNHPYTNFNNNQVFNNNISGSTYSNYYNNPHNPNIPMNYPPRMKNSSNCINTNHPQTSSIVNQTNIINNINIISNQKLNLSVNPSEKISSKSPMVNNKDDIQQIINQTIRKSSNKEVIEDKKLIKLNNNNNIIETPSVLINKREGNKVEENYSKQIDCLKQSNLCLRVAIKLKNNVEKFIEIKENDDILSIIKIFCEENQLNGDVIFPILHKINASLCFFNDIGSFEINDEIEKILKEALEIYNDYGRIENLINDEIFNNTFEEFSGEAATEMKKKRGCSV